MGAELIGGQPRSATTSRHASALDTLVRSIRPACR